MTPADLHAAHCGPARGGFKVCYCDQACCRRGGQCVCTECRALPECRGNEGPK